MGWSAAFTQPAAEYEDEWRMHPHTLYALAFVGSRNSTFEDYLVNSMAHFFLRFRFNQYERK